MLNTQYVKRSIASAIHHVMKNNQIQTLVINKTNVDLVNINALFADDDDYFSQYDLVLTTNDISSVIVSRTNETKCKLNTEFKLTWDTLSQYLPDNVCHMLEY